MDHKFVLNFILKHACPHHVGEQWNEYYIETHCERLYVRAKPVGEGEYEIVSVEKAS